MKKILIAFLLLFAMPAMAADIAPVHSLVTGRISADINNFGASLGENFDARGNISPAFVPVEAKVGGWLMSALSEVARAVYSGILPFLNAFVIALFMLWVFMEAWQMMNDEKPDAMGLAVRIAKRMAIIMIWLWILNNNPAEIFMWIMSPVITIGTAASNLIMDSTANIVGVVVPDTCAAIHGWLDGDKSMIISGPAAADLLCVPTRVATYFYTFVWTGFQWMLAGIGKNGLNFLMGFVFVCLFVYNIWKFALAALGVVVDLFFVLLFMPFTAVKECFGDVKYKGIFLPVWENLLGFVKGASLEAQFIKFINAVIYFIVLSIVSAICVILLAGVNPAAGGDFMSILIIGCLAAYLMSKTDDIAGKLSGKIDTSFGAEAEGYIKSAVKGIADTGKKIAKLFAKKK